MRQLAYVFLLGVVLLPVTGLADTIEYQFSFTNLHNNNFPFNPYADFTVDVVTNGFITVTGISTLIPPRPTSLGYNVNNFGENIRGDFFFSESGGSLTDLGVSFSSTTFALFPQNVQSAYFQTVGIFAGIIEGNAPFAFSGDATLTIANLSVPEPFTFSLLGSGLLGVAYAGRRRLLGL